MFLKFLILYLIPIYFGIWNASEIVLIHGLRVEEYFETSHIRPSFTNIEGNSNEINKRTLSQLKYREYAETEFNRPGYFPVPYVVGGTVGDLRTLPIPNVDLSTLIRQHISHQRTKIAQVHAQRQLNTDFPATVLNGVNKFTELRQTPYRRFPESSPLNQLSYEEKRRRWKADLKRRLRGPKIPARERQNSIMLSNLSMPNPEGEHYYITYTPQTRIYQVSRRPPENLHYETEQRNEITSEVIHSNEETTPIPDADRVETSNIVEPTQKEDHSKPLFDADSEEDDQNNADELIMTTIPPQPRNYLDKPDFEPTTTQATTTTTTTTKPTTTITTRTLPSVILIQKTEPISANHTYSQQIRVAAQPDSDANSLDYPVVKQILHLDDYYQELDEVQNNESISTEEEEEKEEFPNNTSNDSSNQFTDNNQSNFNSSNLLDTVNNEHTTSQPTAIVYPINNVNDHFSTTTTKLPYALMTSTTMTSTRVRNYGYNKVNHTPQTADDYQEEDEEEDDDLFFWKSDFQNQRTYSSLNRRSSAGVNSRSYDSPILNNDGKDPFQIIVHGENKKI